MATVSEATSAHATLSGTTVDTVTLTAPFEKVEVLNRGTTTTLYITYGAKAADVATPTAAGAGTLAVPPGAVVTLDANARGSFTVKIIGNGEGYSVQGVDG